MYVLCAVTSFVLFKLAPGKLIIYMVNIFTMRINTKIGWLLRYDRRAKAIYYSFEMHWINSMAANVNYKVKPKVIMKKNGTSSVQHE